MKKVITLFLFVAFCFLLNGCTAINEEQKNEEAFKIVRDMYQKNPNFSFYKNFQNNNYIFTYVNGDFIVLKEFAKTWQNNYSTHFGELFSENEYEVKDIKNDVLFYVLTLDQGSALGTANYNVYSLKDNTIYTISAFGAHGSYNDMTIPDSLKNNRADILTYLEDKISNSKYTYIPKEADLNIDIPQNAIKSWNLSNEDIYKKIDSQPSQWTPLSVKKFNTSNIEDFFNDSVSKEYIKDSKWEVENDSFKITSYFKGAIYVYDKKQDNYFIIWVPSDVYDWIEKIEFSDNQMIILYDRMTGEQKYKIDLQKMAIIKL